jgi:hypothetical protein
MAEIETMDEEADYMAIRKYYRQQMKTFNVTKKYFKSIYAFVWCEICNEIVASEINKDDIRNGLQTGLYIHKYTHKNLAKDPEETEDKSDTEHSVMIYIDAHYDVRGVRTFFGKAISSEELEKGAKIPIVVKEIPTMAVHLGMVSPDEYKILQICDGNNTLEDVLEISGYGASMKNSSGQLFTDTERMANLEKMMQKLRDKGLINIIRRA